MGVLDGCALPRSHLGFTEHPSVFSADGSSVMVALFPELGVLCGQLPVVWGHGTCCYNNYFLKVGFFIIN